MSSSAPNAEAEPKANLFIVGVGASAGGLEALQRLFEGMPRTGEMAFVVVQHLSPDFKSLMTELLTPHTQLAIRRVVDGTTVEPDTIYLMPPRQEMTIAGGKLYLTERDPAKGLSLPIDSFFRSLAEDAGTRAVAIVLSGTGSDGSRGIRPIHEAGGLVIAESEDSAKFSGMPRSAADTGLVDLVLAPEAMPAALARYVEREGVLDEPARETTDAMSRVFELLKRECGVDFADYKESTVGRRIERRLLLSDTKELERYVERLNGDAAELHALYKDLLIGVTRFFRDADAFERLREDVLPGMIDKLPENEELRAWVPACATGEEPYSLAIQLSEAFAEKRRQPAFRIFATDVHRHSLELASAGIYPAESLDNVPPALRERHFTPHPEGFQISAELRGRIVFAHHNVVRDAPFTRLDLLTCRNLLIYFKPHCQRRVLALFHFALKTGGVLMLGPSETPGALGDEFGTLDARWKIFRKTRDVRVAPDMKLSSAGPVERVGRPSASGPLEDPRVSRLRGQLLERYAPPTVLVDETGRILHTFSGAAEFLAPRDGRPSLNLTDLLQGELRFVVAGALKKAQKDRHQVAYAGIAATTTREQRRVRVVVDWLPGSDRFADSFAVTFEVDRPAVDVALEPAPTHEQRAVGELLEERLSSVEGELRLTKENLQATVEEMETSNEELQATNEELIASNEELQSTNEELHSVNEELYTVNAEYQAKINELTELHADMNHLLEATEVHTIFLDRNLRLRKFTPRIAETFNLLPQDLGRRLDVFAHGFDDPAFMSDIERVAAEGGTVEREIADRHGKAYLLRILPYNGQSSLDGVVVTLVDISAVKRAQQALFTSEERYRTLVRSVTAILWTADAEGRITSPQSEWEAYTGHPFDVHKDDGWLVAVHPDDRAAIAAAWTRAVAEQRPFEATGRLFSQAHGDYRYFVARAAPILQGPPGKESVREWVGHIIDTHENRMTQMQVQRQDEQLRSILDNSPAFIWVKDPGGRYLVAGKQCETVLGVPCAEVVGKTDHDFLPAASAEVLRISERRVLDGGETVESEEIVPVAGELRTFLTVKFPLRDERGNIYAVAGISTDITERKRQAEEIKGAVERRDQFLAMLSHELRTPLGAILNAADLVDRKDGNGVGNGASRSGNGHDKDGGAHKDGNGQAAFARDVIKRQTRHMAKLLEDLLDVGRITRDQLLLEPHPVDLRTVIEEAAEVVKPECDRRGLDLRIELPTHALPVWGDNVRLRQVFTNLLANATTYTPAGHIDVSARLQKDDEGQDQIVVTVADTGVGMSTIDRERVFELFYQSPQTLERKRGGLGVGLTLALKLVKLHGGELTADSRGPNQGSVFTVTLPRSERAAAASDAAAAPAPQQKQGKLRIVVVEDNQDIRDTLEDLLRLDGHEVISAKEGIGGAERIVEACPDVAIVDVGLPGMDGYAVAKAVRAARGKAVHLIALTGYGRREDRIEAAQAGFDRHLVKPVDHELLTQALADLLARPDA